MSEENQLIQDLTKLDTLYEELLWGHNDELDFRIEYLNGSGRIIISNKTQEGR